LIPEGTTIISGNPKSGKSLLIYNIVLDIIQGGLALGYFPTQKNEVLFLALEDG